MFGLQDSIRVCVCVVYVYVSCFWLLVKYHCAYVILRHQTLSHSLSFPMCYMLMLQDTIRVRVCVMCLDHVAAGEVLQCVCHSEAALLDQWGGIYQRVA